MRRSGILKSWAPVVDMGGDFTGFLLVGTSGWAYRGAGATRLYERAEAATLPASSSRSRT